MKTTGKLSVLTVVCAAAFALRPPAARAAVELMPVIGISEMTDEDRDAYDWGAHGALSIGGRVSDVLSIHGQLNLHLLNVDENVIPDGEGWAFSVGIAPLLHFHANENVSLVLAPSLALYRGNLAFAVFNQVFEARVIGLQLGVGFGLLFRTRSGFALGPVVSYARVFPTEVCWTAFGRATCDDDPNSDDFGLVTIGLGFLF